MAAEMQACINAVFISGAVLGFVCGILAVVFLSLASGRVSLCAGKVNVS